jgi:hypothetical protein
LTSGGNGGREGKPGSGSMMERMRFEGFFPDILTSLTSGRKRGKARKWLHEGEGEIYGILS